MFILALGFCVVENILLLIVCSAYLYEVFAKKRDPLGIYMRSVMGFWMISVIALCLVSLPFLPWFRGIATY